MDKKWLKLDGIKPLALKIALVALLQAGAVVVQACFLAEALSLLFDGRPYRDVIPSLLLFTVGLVIRQTLVWLQQRLAGSYAELRSEEERNRLVASVFERGPQFVAREGSGRLVTLAIEGVDRFRTYLEMSIPRAIDTPMITLVVLMYTYWLDYVSGLILTAAMPVIIGFFIILGLAARKQADQQWGTFRYLAGHFADALRGITTLMALGKSRAHGQMVAKTAEQYRKTVMRTLRVAFLSSLSLDVFSMLAIASVAVGLGLRLIEGNIEFGAALAVLLLAPEYFAPIRQLGSEYHASLDGKEAWESLSAVESDSFSPIFSSEAQIQHRKWEENTVLKLDRVSVRNQEGKALLHQISLQMLPQNRWIGIVGASGSGKTTLLRLISGMIEPSDGEVRLNAKLLQGEIRKQWHSQIAYIPQHPHLFSLTLADNIRFYEPTASDSDVERAIEAVGLSEWVRTLPHGKEELIGEGGRMLSGGQAQRVALARALVSCRPIVLLDEPTAHLDVETEWELKQTLLHVLADKRVIMATHRLHWMKEMQEVWVMENGRIVEKGTHENLRQLGGVYTRLLGNGKERRNQV